MSDRPRRFLSACVLVLTLWLLAGAAAAQDPARNRRVARAGEAVADTALVKERGDTVLLPILGYTPDTGLMFGALALRFFYLDPPGDDTRPSVFSPVVIYTLKNQIMIFAGTDLNWGDGRWHAGLMPSYQKFPDDFYGIGRDVPTEPIETYTPEQFAFEGLLEREVVGELRLGVNYRVAKHQLLETEPGGVLDGDQVLGTGKEVMSAPGLQLAWDSRDHTWGPRRGLWLQGAVSLYREGWGSDHRLTEYLVDLRGYVPLGEQGTVAGQIQYTSLDGAAPFYQMPRLGGQSGLRGYSGGRFLDRTMLLARAEWRSGPVWKKFGGVVFAGMGDVAPRPAVLTTAAQLYTFGFGLRYTLSDEEKVNIRVDFGFGNDDGGFYLSLGEAF